MLAMKKILLLPALLGSSLCAAEPMKRSELIESMALPYASEELRPSLAFFPTRAALVQGDYEFVLDLRNMPQTAQWFEARFKAADNKNPDINFRGLTDATFASSKGNAASFNKQVSSMILFFAVHRVKNTATVNQLPFVDKFLNEQMAQFSQCKLAPVYLSLHLTKGRARNAWARFVQEMDSEEYLKRTPSTHPNTLVWSWDVQAQMKNLLQQKDLSPTLLSKLKLEPIQIAIHMPDDQTIVLMGSTGDAALKHYFSQADAGKYWADLSPVSLSPNLAINAEFSADAANALLNVDKMRELLRLLEQFYASGDKKHPILEFLNKNSVMSDLFCTPVAKLIPHFTGPSQLQILCGDDLDARFTTSWSNYVHTPSRPVARGLVDKPEMRVYGEMSPMTYPSLLPDVQKSIDVAFSLFSSVVSKDAGVSEGSSLMGGLSGAAIGMLQPFASGLVDEAAHVFSSMRGDAGVYLAKASGGDKDSEAAVFASVGDAQKLRTHYRALFKKLDPIVLLLSPETSQKPEYQQLKMAADRFVDRKQPVIVLADSASLTRTIEQMAAQSESAQVENGGVLMLNFAAMDKRESKIQAAPIDFTMRSMQTGQKKDVRFKLRLKYPK